MVQVASAATRAVLAANGATAEALAEKLVCAEAQQLAMWDQVALVHRLNEHFAACG